jgi:hypothetical protein
MHRFIFVPQLVLTDFHSLLACCLMFLTLVIINVVVFVLNIVLVYLFSPSLRSLAGVSYSCAFVGSRVLATRMHSSWPIKPRVFKDPPCSSGFCQLGGVNLDISLEEFFDLYVVHNPSVSIKRKYKIVYEAIDICEFAIRRIGLSNEGIVVDFCVLLLYRGVFGKVCIPCPYYTRIRDLLIDHFGEYTLNDQQALDILHKARKSIARLSKSKSS